MRRFLQAYGRVLALITIIAIAAVLALVLHGSGSRYESRQACDVLTPRIARAVTGRSLTQQRPKTIDTTDTQTTFCVYRGDAASVALVVRMPKSEAGASANQAAFKSPPVSSQRVAGYGDSAFWTPSFGQLNILSNNTWYIMNAGPNKPADRTVKQSTDLARQLRL